MKFPVSVSIALAAFLLAGASSEARLAVSRATAANLLEALVAELTTSQT